MGFGRSGAHLVATFSAIASPRPFSLTCIVNDDLADALEKLTFRQIVQVMLEDNDTGTIHGMKLVAIEPATDSEEVSPA